MLPSQSLRSSSVNVYWTPKTRISSSRQNVVSQKRHHLVVLRGSTWQWMTMEMRMRCGWCGQIRPMRDRRRASDSWLRRRGRGMLMMR
ncbi:hypothetical protein INR49_023947, partial [Caranx melampygus]